MSTTVKNVLSPNAISRIVLGWVAVLALSLITPFLPESMATWSIFGLLAFVIVIIVVCAGGVVTQAEHLARRLGDPYGTLILTLSIVLIEVILISAVMLGPGDHTTIARDSVMSATMLVLTLTVGVALLLGDRRGKELRVNPTGTSIYLSMLVVLTATAFAVPAVIGVEGAYTTSQSVMIIIVTVLLYGFFLYRQTGAQSIDFQEPGNTRDDDIPTRLCVVLRDNIGEIILRVLVLLITVVPIVVLSHDMAAFLDTGLARLGAPVALSGLMVSLIVFLPEALTTVRAAWQGEAQRVTNLAHGALVSCVGLTLPTVLTIGLLTNQTVVMAESPANLAILAVSLLLSLTTFSAPRLTAVHGAAHCVVFVVYVMNIFS